MAGLLGGTLGIAALARAAAVSPAAAQQKQALLNVSCDPTWALCKDLDKAFAADYRKRTGIDVAIRQSHGGSGAQARSVIDGLDADVLTLAPVYDIDALHERGRLLAADRQQRLPQNRSSHASAIVSLKRPGGSEAQARAFVAEGTGARQARHRRAILVHSVRTARSSEFPRTAPLRLAAAG